jgi:hypothetical protein
MPARRRAQSGFGDGIDESQRRNPPRKRVLVRAQTDDRRQLTELPGVAASEHDVVRAHGRGEPLDRLEDGGPPLLLAEALAAALADVVLEGRLAEGQVRELKRLDDNAVHECRAEAAAEPEKQHHAALVAAERLHRGVVHLRRLAERVFEVEPDPPGAQVHRLGGHSAAVYRRGDSDRAGVVGPVRGHVEDAVDHPAGSQVRPRVEAPALVPAREQHLDVRAADVDREYLPDCLLTAHRVRLTRVQRIARG